MLKQPKVPIFDEAVSNFGQQNAEHFAQTVNKLKGKVNILFITHQLPKGFNVDKLVILGKDKNEQQQGGMNCMRVFKVISLGLILCMMSLTSCGSGSEKWKEEVLLHDGSKLILDRSQKYGGSHEVGQKLPIKEHTIRFKLPNTSQLITWKSEYGEDIGRSNFDLLALDIVNSIPYIVANPNLCLSYNKWGRPNPPYIFFKYVNQQWKQIPLSEFPVEIKQINTLLSTYGNSDVDGAIKSGFVSADTVRKLNWPPRRDRAPQFKSILREPIEKVGCPDWNHESFKAPLPMAPNGSQPLNFSGKQGK